jgi:predicted transcriptional regulator
VSLKNLAADIEKSGRPKKLTVRTLLGLIGQARRGKNVAKRLRVELRKNGLKTEPDFEIVHIDATVTVRPYVPEPKPPTPSDHQVPSPAISKDGADSEEVDPERDVVLTIGQILEAGKTPVFIRRDDTIERGVTLLLQENLTHLVVSQNERNVDGLVSWQSIGRARASQRPVKTVGDCMDADPHVVSFSAALFDTVRHIILAGAVLVKGSDGKISGVVTAADIATQFIVLSEPFLYLEQCESHLRTLLRRAKAGAEVLRGFVDPRDEERAKKLKDADDLTFGETIRAIGSTEIWEKLKLGLDRKTLIARLEQMREIRNTVMHFHPDGISDNERDLLRKTRQMLQDL